MEIFKNSQILKLFLLAALLIVTPLLSAPLRSKFLYFIVNILIVAVGAEAGLLSFFFSSDSTKNNKRTSPMIRPHVVVSEFSLDDDLEKVFVDQCRNQLTVKCSPKKVVDEEQKVVMEEYLPSTPSIFFIEDQSVEDGVDDDDDEREEVGEMSGQELYQKAEMFIGDFYKQLKMQREESWKKLHDLCHKAF